jgi:hypothetical protein
MLMATLSLIAGETITVIGGRSSRGGDVRAASDVGYRTDLVTSGLRRAFRAFRGAGLG